MKTDDIIIRLRKRTYGHGAFGESESYSPSDLNIEASTEIENLRGEIGRLLSVIVNRDCEILLADIIYRYAAT